LKVPVKVVLSDLSTNGRDYFFNTATIYPSKVADQGSPAIGKDGIAYFTNSAKVGGREVVAEIWDIGADFRGNPDMRMDLP
jgi:hypothetical protein